jgi:hypothetical protein
MRMTRKKAGSSARATDFDPDRLPLPLVDRCRRLVESYHRMHGYRRLPDMLWMCGLASFIEENSKLRSLVKMASTNRSAKKADKYFSQIAVSVLATEILASGIGEWNTIFPEAASAARRALEPRLWRRMLLVKVYSERPIHMECDLALSAIFSLCSNVEGACDHPPMPAAMHSPPGADIFPSAPSSDGDQAMERAPA